MIANYSYGIEEEFFISSRETRRPLPRLPQAFHAELSTALAGSLRHEMLQSQLETATPPLVEMGAGLETLASQRRRLAAVAESHGMIVLASGTHPIARWDSQRPSPKRRYHQLMHALQMLGSRNILCGLHVHVAVPDPSTRVDLMRRIIPYLPVFLALSTSSPFWQGRRTGLMGYRLAAYDELPRTGLPELFRDEGDYRRYVDALVGSGAIPDESYIWWAVRPASKYPTLELRIADSCTDVRHSVAIAALYRCLVRHLVENPALNAGIGAVERAIAVENKWIAQRDGIRGALVDAAGGTLRAVPEIVEEMLAMLDGDAGALDCRAEIATVRDILRDGTSACRQIARADEAAAAGRDSPESLAAVVDWLAERTAAAPAATGRATLH
jgi:glutamate---cysteine ligase / carboxylate-amine ligase